MEVGFDAFEKIVNSVGGVEAELTESEANYLNTTNYISKKKYRHVKVGKQKLRSPLLQAASTRLSSLQSCLASKH